MEFVAEISEIVGVQRWKLLRGESERHISPLSQSGHNS